MVILFVWVAWKNMMEMGRGGLHMDGWFLLGGLHVNGYFVCVGLSGKILRSVVGAVPMCPPVSPCKGASIITPRTMHVFLAWKRRYADVRAGTQAPPLRFRLGGLHVDG